jgi:predicted nucleic acid-binding protein
VIVVDASVVTDLVLDLPPHAAAIRRRLDREGPDVAAPHLVDVEVLSAVRRLLRKGEVTEARARAGLAVLLGMPLKRHDHGPLLDRAFELRHHVSAYDAVYMALAEALGAPLLTRDVPLWHVPGVRARVEVVS